MKKINLQTNIRADIAAMSAYVPVASVWDVSTAFNQKPEEIIKLDAGESQFGFSPLVTEAVSRGLFNYYPDPEYKELRQALSNYAGVPVANIIVGSGSDELLDLVFRLLLNEGDIVINCPPTFGMYTVTVELNRGQLISVPRKSDFSLDVSGIKQALNPKVKAIVVCSPNNPTGTVTSQTEIVELLETGKLVIVDEAYYEFSSKTVVPLIQRYPNLIVLRTLSKWAGLAGLRLGYGVMDKFLVEQLFKIKPPYNVNIAADLAGIAALADTAWRKKILRQVVSERQRLSKELGELPNLIVFPSKANSLFIAVKRNYQKLKDFLIQQKIVVRYYDFYQAIRLTIGQRWQNDAVVQALKTFTSQQYDAVIFDMDGVLVDVTKSYRQAIALTVAYVLKNTYGLKVRVQAADIAAIKAIPGFNNDWDVSWTLIKLISKGIERSNYSKAVQVVDDQLRDSTAYQNVKAVFQSYYLGSKLFLQRYQRPAPVVVSKGLIENESLLINRAVLQKLAQNYKLGVATGRPKFEALFALKNFGITPQFIIEKNVVAAEDALREKPYPDPLLKAAQLLNSKQPIYVGDSISDVLAAQSAAMPCIFVGSNEQADYAVKRTDQIGEILL